MPGPKPNRLHDDLDALLDGRPVELTDELVPLVEAADALGGELATYELDPEVADRHLARVLEDSATVVALPVRGYVSGWRRRMAAVVLAALRELSPDQREVLLLRMGAGLSAPEVAETLGKTIGAVKALQHRGLASLARVLGGLRSPHQAQDRPYPSPDPARLTSQEEEER